MIPAHDPHPLTVLKLGSSVLPSEAALAGAVSEIERWVAAPGALVVVVSALGDTTDHLLERAGALADWPRPDALAAYLSTGEEQTLALLAIALQRRAEGGGPLTGRPRPAIVRPRDVGLVADGERLDAMPRELDVSAFRRRLARAPLVLFPGFVARSPEGGAALLGRGGSDLTALFLAHRLGATNCRLVKALDGIVEGDPDVSNRFYASMHWNDAVALGAGAVQAKALKFAAEQRVAFEVAAPGSSAGTRVGSEATMLRSA